MTIDRHACFGGGLQLGGSLDCPKCWTALEASVDLSFPGAPEPYEAEILPEISQLEHQLQCSCSSCDPRTCAYCGRQDKACTFCKPRNEDGHA